MFTEETKYFLQIILKEKSECYANIFCMQQKVASLDVSVNH